jgi:hypothetical protein
MSNSTLMPDINAQPPRAAPAGRRAVRARQVRPIPKDSFFSAIELPSSSQINIGASATHAVPSAQDKRCRLTTTAANPIPECDRRHGSTCAARHYSMS